MGALKISTAHIIVIFGILMHILRFIEYIPFIYF